MSRVWFVAGIWAVLLAVIALLAYWAGPEPAREVRNGDALSLHSSVREAPSRDSVLPKELPASGAADASSTRETKTPNPARVDESARVVEPTRVDTTKQTPTPSAPVEPARATTPAIAPNVAGNDAQSGGTLAPAVVNPPPVSSSAKASNTSAPRAGETGTASALSPTKPPRPIPQRDGSTESGIPGLGSLPPGPGAAYQGLGVQVYSRETGQPVVGARVRFALEADLAEWQRAHPETPLEQADPEMVLQICKQPLQTKQGGVALTDSAPGRMLVDASMGRQYGFAWVDRDNAARARIDIVDDRAIAVHARDEQGTTLTNVAAVVRDSSCAELWRGVSDANGSTLWRHASFLIERDASPGACVVSLESLESNPPFELIRRPLNSARDIVLATKASASLRVNVVDANGARVTEPLVITASTNTSVACRSAVRRTLVDGALEFELVEPGLDIALDIDGKSYFESASRTVRGPTAAGEKRTVDVTCGRRLSVVRAKLLGADKKPLVKTKALAWLEYEEGSRVSSLAALALAESDGAGNVRFTLPHAPVAAKSERLLIVAQNEFGDWFSAERVALAAKLGDTEFDLGERHLVEMPTLAAGYVLSDKGWPVPNAIVEASASDDPDADPETFVADVRFNAVADQLGRFRLRGWIDGSRIALTCSAPDHSRPLRRVVERGERKVALELPRSAVIRGKVLPPTGTAYSNVRIYVERADEAIPAGVDSNLTWRCAGLAAGTYDVRVMVDGLDEPVFALPAVVLAPGTDLNDPLRTTIDLRARVTRFVLRVIDAQGTPIQVGSAVVTEPREEGPYSRTVAIANGVLEVIALRPAVDIEIRADGFETLFLRAVDHGGDARLVSSKEN